MVSVRWYLGRQKRQAGGVGGWKIWASTIARSLARIHVSKSEQWQPCSGSIGQEGDVLHRGANPRAACMAA